MTDRPNYTVPLTGFSVVRRNFGHWDITSRNFGRLFRIRGGPGQWVVFDERPQGVRKETSIHKEQCQAMSYVCSELMYELIIAEGQKPTIIEGWNVS